ncbi:MAG: peptidoglycan-associated lipoprotein Pal [Thermodesulfobacteriota bacterium]
MRGNILKVVCVAGLIASVSFFTAGCTPKQTVDSDDTGDSASSSTTTTSTTPDTGDTAGTYEPIDSGSDTASADAKISEGRTNEGLLPIYFDFDKSNIRDDQKARLEGNAEFVKADSNLKITIEGNCDERGTNEYNIALGERRAQTAKKYLINLGVSADSLYTVSYGEERPLLYGHDEYSWSQNRRDDFVIK